MISRVCHGSAPEPTSPARSSASSWRTAARSSSAAYSAASWTRGLGVPRAATSRRAGSSSSTTQLAEASSSSARRVLTVSSSGSGSSEAIIAVAVSCKRSSLPASCCDSCASALLRRLSACHAPSVLNERWAMISGTMPGTVSQGSICHSAASTPPRGSVMKCTHCTSRKLEPYTGKSFCCDVSAITVETNNVLQV